MGKTYTDEELISELQRFYKEKGKVPIAHDMTNKNGYPSYYSYMTHFETWNNALIVAELVPINIKRKIDGTEVCSYCGRRADEIPGQTHWLYDEEGNRFCFKHGQRNKPDYVRGELDINSTTGIGRVGEILVVKTLGIEKKYDYNRESCNYPIDLYHEEYGKIDVKTSLLSNEYYSRWVFHFNTKEVIDTYICIGLSSDRKTVEHVWVVPNEGEIRDLTSLNIKNGQFSLSTNQEWEVNVKPYNDVWETMKLKTCNSMTDKSKHVPTRTWEETLEALAELNKKYGVKSSV